MLACVVALAAVVVTATAFGSAKAPSTQKASFTAALVSDIGKFTDKGFNQNQLKGLNTAKSKLGVSTIALQSNSTSDYAPNFNTAIRKGAKLVVAAGFLLAPTEATYAKKFPNVDFAITDYTVHTAPFANKAGKVLPAFKNVEGLTYAANESGCLVGVLAAKMAKKMGGNTVGAVGGLKIPPVDRYIAGFQFGAKKADPGIQTLNDYSQDFVAQAKCKEKALNQIAQGSDVEFQVAGQCGLGVLDAAHSKGVFGVGVDADQGYLGSWVMTSALKKVDVAVLAAIKAGKSGSLKGGKNVTFGASVNGVGYGKWSSKVPASIKAAVAAQFKLLKAGKIKGIPATVK